MGYKVDHEQYADALKRIADYTYALLYQLSGIRLCSAADLTEHDFKECTEARLFREDEELHLFPDEGKAVRVSDEGKEDSLTTRFALSNKFRKTGSKRVIVKQYLEADDDGQMKVVLTRLAGLE